MKLKPIINSLLETDAYKLNMNAVCLEKFSTDRCKWAFRCRNDDVRFTEEMIEEICEQIHHFCSLRFSAEERFWLHEKFPWLKQSYIDYLRLWQPCQNHISINMPWHQKYNDCGLTIEANGSWLDTMMYEIPILAIVNEVYFAFKYGEGKLDEYVMNVTQAKIDRLRKREINIGTFSEFGMRRRYSAATQDLIVAGLKYSKIPGFVGTSNVYLAKKYGVTAVGTQAHEFFMCQQGHHEINPAYSNRFALQAWNDYYKTKLGIALTDTIGTDVFLRDFDENFSTLFSGVRHDSGDPFEWGEKMIAHYKKFSIAPQTKTLLFSDSLNLGKAARLYEHFKDRAKVAFGIGTYWTAPFDAESLNEYPLPLPVDDLHPLNIVMKPIEFNGAPVCKLSNDPGKAMSQDKEYIDYLRRTIDWRLAHEKEV